MKISHNNVGSISAALSCLVYPPQGSSSSGRSAGSFPEQRLLFEPNTNGDHPYLETESCPGNSGKAFQTGMQEASERRSSTEQTLLE